MQDQIFLNKTWSAASVYDETVHNLKHLKLAFAIFRVLTDLDEQKEVPADWLFSNA